MAFTKLFSCQLLLLITLSCAGQQRAAAIVDINGTSMITVANGTSDSIRIEIENWYAVPFDAQNLDTVLAPSGTLAYQLTVQGRNYYNLVVAKTKYRLFTQPNATDSVMLSDAGGLAFTGDGAEINDFLRANAIAFGSADADWMPRAQATHRAAEYSTILAVNDSVTQKHISFLQLHSDDLPAWYVTFETERLKYKNAAFKINSFFYRKIMMGKVERLPPGFLDQIRASVVVQNPAMVGNMAYIYFLNDYIYYRTDPDFSSPKPTSKTAWINRYQKRLATANRELTGLVRDFYFASFISTIIETRRYALQTRWIKEIQDERLRNLLHRQMAAHEVLPPGAKLPYFHLQAMDSSDYEPVDFQNKILLINFWATWCKPCIQQFPEENKLVARFRDEPVAIVNICVDSGLAAWKKLVDKHNLKTLNLIATGNWNDVLSEHFDIGALPHSVLVDWNGEVVQNKCPGAGDGIDTQITSLLREMTSEKGETAE